MKSSCAGEPGGYDNLFCARAQLWRWKFTTDAVGNRLTQTIITNTTVYIYDIANWLTNVGAQAYTWYHNGNLLNDGVFTYTYDTAKRLATLTYTYSYNGLGDRFKQVLNCAYWFYVRFYRKK